MEEFLSWEEPMRRSQHLYAKGADEFVKEFVIRN